LPTSADEFAHQNAPKKSEKNANAAQTWGRLAVPAIFLGFNQPSGPVPYPS